MLIGSGLRGISLKAAHNPHLAASLFHSPFAPRPLATSLRLYQQGDTWEYRVSGTATTATTASGNTATITDGNLRSTIMSVGFGDKFNTLDEEDALNMTASASGGTKAFSHVSHQSLSQDPWRATTYLMSDNGGSQDSIRHVRQPQVETPGVWSAALSQSSHLDFDDGESHDETTTVQGSEVVDTVLGRLTVWRCAQDETDSDGTKTSTTLWFAPQLGMPVKTSGTITTPNGMVMTLITELTKTSVSL